MENILGDRLQVARKAKNISQVDLAKQLGIKQVMSVSRWENNTRKPRLKILSQMATIYDVSLEWLLTGKGTMHKEANKKSPRSDAEANVFSVPQYDIEAAAGPGCFPNSEDIKGYIPFDKNYLNDIAPGGVNNLCLVTVSGDSMEPTFKNGDLAMIDLTANAPKNEQVYLIRYDDSLCIKRIQIMPAGAIQISSDNRVHAPFILKQSDVKILGKAVWFGRKMV